jgi:CheY-like chemotaxis protein
MNAHRILVVDDDATYLTCTRDLLEADGYEVIVHRNGFGATEKVMTERPDLVLLDVNMPALSGEALVGVLRGREQTRGTRILLYSSNDEDTLRRAVDRLGVEGYVCKGDPRQLRLEVARLLRDVRALAGA